MQIEGKNSIKEAIITNKTINSVFLQKNLINGSLKDVFDMLRDNQIKFKMVDKAFLESKQKTPNCQGVIAEIIDFKYSHIDEIVENVREKNKDGLIVMLDGIEDPHNLGNIIRTCECAGVDGIVIPKDRACKINETVYKTSAGAVNHMKIAMVTNINDAINKLKSDGYWVYATEMNGKTAKCFDLTGNIVIIIGNEGNGIHDRTLKLSDGIISIEMFGKLNSLNAGTATGIVLWQALEQRKK